MFCAHGPVLHQRTGKSIQEKTIVLPSNTVINPVTEFTEFTDYQVHEKDLINLVNAGKEFYGDTFNSGHNNKYIFNFPNPSLTENAVKVNLDVAATVEPDLFDAYTNFQRLP